MQEPGVSSIISASLEDEVVALAAADAPPVPAEDVREPVGVLSAGNG
jgi:hypothetical protein